MALTGSSKRTIKPFWGGEGGGGLVSVLTSKAPAGRSAIPQGLEGPHGGSAQGKGALPAHSVSKALRSAPQHREAQRGNENTQMLQ